MRTKKQIIELIREGKLVLDIDGFQRTQTAKDVLNEIDGYGWMAEFRYYGIDKGGKFMFLYKSELNYREIITLQEYLDSPSLSEIPTDQFQGSKDYDEKLLDEFTIYLYEEYGIAISSNTVHFYLNKRYNSDLLKEKEQLEQRLKEINEQLKGN